MAAKPAGIHIVEQNYVTVSLCIAGSDDGRFAAGKNRDGMAGNGQREDEGSSPYHRRQPEGVAGVATPHYLTCVDDPPIF